MDSINTLQEREYIPFSETNEKAEHVCDKCGSTENVGTRINGCIRRMCLDCVGKEAIQTNCPQLWESYDDKQFWIFPNGAIYYIEDTERK